MKITEIRVRNYKSLRDVTWQPGQMSVVVGANGSGKSNLADFFDFLSNIYTDGLSKAVVRKGGYENISYRKSRRAKGGITIAVQAEFDPPNRAHPLFSIADSQYKTRFFHHFTFRAEGESIMAEFKITEEMFSIQREVEGEWKNLFSLTRNGERISGKCIKEEDRLEKADDYLMYYFKSLFKESDTDFPAVLQNTELLLHLSGMKVPHVNPFIFALSSIQVLQINTATARESGVPASDQILGQHGEQLPTLIDWLQQKHRPIWNQILGMMRNLMPDLKSIEVDYTDVKTRGLFFHEVGIGRPWRVDEISDGTIHCLAFLVGLFDPRSTMVLIEEPENSVHAWILRELMGEAKDESETKQIAFTTHSPFVVNSVHPNDVWVIWRRNAESKIARITEIDRGVGTMVLEGGLTTFEYLDSGDMQWVLPLATGIAAE